ncbi:MAG TPA: response regulator [Aggregatilineales bacterium]|nr:response regulator [Anaerolineales bacterium]HRE48199.1 response regulator [Aggregatilineales bacterium]
MASKDILVVEDDRDAQELLMYIFKTEGISADMASTAEDAEGHLALTHYTFALIDLSLKPGIDGWELFSRIKKNPQTATLPCYALTGYGVADLKKALQEEGFLELIQKPIDVKVFRSWLRSKLNSPM